MGTKLNQKQMDGLIAVLQAGDPEYNLTTHEVRAARRIMERLNIPVAAIGAQQANPSGPGNVDVRDLDDLIQNFGMSLDAPLYMKFSINGEWRDVAPMLKKVSSDGFTCQEYCELFDDIMKNVPGRTGIGEMMNVDGRRTGKAVEEIFNRIVAEELKKLPAAKK